MEIKTICSDFFFLIWRSYLYNSIFLNRVICFKLQAHVSMVLPLDASFDFCEECKKKKRKSEEFISGFQTYWGIWNCTVIVTHFIAQIKLSDSYSYSRELLPFRQNLVKCPSSLTWSQVVSQMFIIWTAGSNSQHNPNTGIVSPLQQPSAV